MNRTFVYKLKPTKAQEAGLERYLDATRWLYNCALEHRIAAYRAGHRVREFDQNLEMPAIRRLPGWEELGACNASAVRLSLRQLDQAFDAFFRRIKVGQKPGFPRFKSKSRWRSFAFPQYGNGVLIVDGQLRVQSVGPIRMRLHRPLGGEPKRVRIVRKADGWHAHILCEIGDPPPLRDGPAVGLDVGIASFATLSTGEQIGNPRLAEKAHANLRQEQRALDRKEKGSNRRRKQRERVAKAHLKVARARRDAHHKLARRLVDEYARIAVEDLQIVNMVRNRALARVISDAGWGQFVEILSSKAESAGCEVVKVPAAGTSQTCNECGVRDPLSRVSQSEFACTACGHEAHADVNAARNIKDRAGAVPVAEGV